MSNIKCHDCVSSEGEYHSFGCDMETCPFCGNQLIGCHCCYEILGIDVSEGTWAYSHGLTSEQEALWLEILEKTGRIPYVRVPVLCLLCGKLYPKMFNVPDEEWNRYVIPELQSAVLCRTCYDTQIKIFPNGWMNSKYHQLLRD